MNVYRVRATRWAEGWELDIEDAGTTQASTLTNAERAVRSYLRLDGRADADAARVELDFAGELGAELSDVNALRRQAAAATEEAAAATRGLAARLVSEGCSGAEVALLLGVTPQRVSQLLSSERGVRQSA